jgi:hypothetical protein
MAGPIKVGCSQSPEARLKSLDIWSPFPLELIVSCEGGHSDERNVHWHLREERLHGEWFAWSERIANLIRFVQRNGQLPPLERAPYGKTGMGRGRNPSRDPELASAKRRLSARIRSAEVHAFTRWEARKNRPAWVNDLQKAWQGPFTPLPEQSEIDRIERYIAELLSRPKDTRSWRDWYGKQAAA